MISMDAPNASRRTLHLAAGLLTLVSATLPLPAFARNDTLYFPSTGTICDRGTRICYDRTGVSLTTTRNEFGNRAENELVRKLSGRPNPREFQFSTGEVCDLRVQTCWDDGWRRSNVSNRLSRQLFGNNGGRNSNSGWNNNGWNNNSGTWNGSRPPGVGWGQPNRDMGFCELSQRSRRLFNGPCDLVQRPTANGTAYLVDFRDGRRYTFYNRQGQLVMTDATGTWPVTYSNTSNGAVLRWGDLQLLARQNGTAGPMPGQTPALNPTGQVLQDLINSLFR